MDRLLHGQTGICTQLDFGLDSDLDGQGCALVVAGRINGDLGTAHSLDAGSLDGGLELGGNRLLMAS